MWVEAGVAGTKTKRLSGGEPSADQKGVETWKRLETHEAFVGWCRV